MVCFMGCYTTNQRAVGHSPIFQSTTEERRGFVQCLCLDLDTDQVVFDNLLAHFWERCSF